MLISLTDATNFGMFAIASAEPEPVLIKYLEKIGNILKTQPGQVIISGHTDSRPFRSDTYDNWRLSSARAQMAYYMLVRGGIDEKRVERIEGHADRDLKVKDNPEAAENRRIEILLRGEEFVRLLAAIGPASGRPLPLPLAAEERQPQPYEMARSLQMLQEDIAHGNRAMLAAQQTLLTAMTARFLAVDAEAWKEPKNVAAVIVHALSGGDPQALRTLLEKNSSARPSCRWRKGTLAYAEGRIPEAAELLATIDARTLLPSVGGYVALTQASLAMEKDPKKSQKMLDTARLAASRQPDRGGRAPPRNPAGGQGRRRRDVRAAGAQRTHPVLDLGLWRASFGRSSPRPSCSSIMARPSRACRCLPAFCIRSSPRPRRNSIWRSRGAR